MALSSYELPHFDWDCAQPLIAMHEINKVFKTAAGEIPVLKSVSVDFNCGQFVSVVGRSGSGKSTLVNMLTGIDHPSRGEVRVANKLIHKLRESDMAIWRGKNLGIVFQFFQLLPTLSLLENVMLPMDFCGMYPPAEREGRAMRLLTQVGLEDYAHKMPGAVSGGQQQSVAVARALANDPPILVADEPTGNLDGRTAEQVMQLFEQQVAQGKTMIMVTHDRDLAKRAQRVLLIVDGELVHEALLAAFPELSHRELLELSKGAETIHFAAGALIDLRELPSEWGFVVRKGSVHIWQRAAWGRRETQRGCLNQGDWFSPDSLGNDITALRTGSDGTELIRFKLSDKISLSANRRTK